MEQLRRDTEFFIRPALPETNDVGEDEAGEVVDDLLAVAGPEPEPISARLRSRGRADRAVLSNQAVECAAIVENITEPALQDDRAVLSNQAVESAALVENSTEPALQASLPCHTGPGHSVSDTHSSMSSSKCSCTFLLMGYSTLTTILVIGLSTILGLKNSGDSCAMEPVIMDNQGQVAIDENTVYNIDLFNSHSVTDEEDPKDSELGCDKTCSHYFSGIQVGEMVCFVLLGCWLVMNWGKCSLWFHGMVKEWKKSARAKKLAKEARKKELLRAELDAERAGHGAEPAAIFRSAGQSAELGVLPKVAVYEETGGCHQAARPTGGCNQADKKSDNATMQF